MKHAPIVVLSTVWIGLLGGGLTGCGSSDPNDPASDAYREAVTAFYWSLAAIQSGTDVGAEEKMRQVTAVAPGEPAAWANLGVLAMRRNNFEDAARYLATARELAPENSEILVLSGQLESLRGHFDEAIAFLRRAIEVDPQNARATYALAQLLERQGAAESNAEVQRLLRHLLDAHPDNLAVMVELARVAARDGDSEALQAVVDRLGERAEGWPAEVQEQFNALRATVDDPAQAASRVAFLKNVLLRVPQYRQSLAAVQTPAERAGELIERFLVLPAPPPAPAPADDSLTFRTERMSDGEESWAVATLLFLRQDEAPSLVLADAETVQVGDREALFYPGGQPPPMVHNLAALDYTYDFLTDLALAGAGGLRVYRQDSTGAFIDATNSLGLSPAIIDAAYTGVWAADVDLEGDLDLILGRAEDPPLVLRNNGDGTFVPQELFPEGAGLRAFVWADVDADGDPDAALIDGSGAVHLLVNERNGLFQRLEEWPGRAHAQALAAADVNADGVVDLVMFQADGTIQRLSGLTDGSAWTSDELARWDGFAGTSVRLFIEDIDNNGALDLIASTDAETRIWLGEEEGFRLLHSNPDVPVYAIADLTDDGKLDLVALSPDGQPLRLVNLSQKPYHGVDIRPRAAQTQGDQRINPFGIGGEVEVRAGLLFQKQPIDGPVVHVGLGEQSTAEIVRIVWPNGDVQAEFDLPTDQAVAAQQRLKGSCPWVFTFDGEGMQFVTDFLWRSPLGLAINAQETAGVMTTEDWVKIRGDQLAPRDGYYDIRITAELWETHFFDHVSLLVVDHSDSIDIFVDERFAFPPPAFQVHALTPPQPVAQAWDDRGADVTDLIQANDAQYLDTFDLGPYQGVARDHYVEIDLGDEVPVEGPVWLVASGWVRPTDSSINVALSQGRHAPPDGLRLEVPDGHGGWTVAKAGLGFPSGKLKTILIDLDGVFKPGTPRRLRLATNLEVYWDALAWATPLPDAGLRTQHLAPDVADLRYRGFSRVTEANRASPELPHYDHLEGTAPRWLDLIGYYTRFGDVRELLATVDDRYVIMNAGDEMHFRFPAPEPPPPGWSRDFVLIGDGWVKDGDYNTAFSKTVLPLPAHDQPAYTTPPARLEDDPVYQRFPEDWHQYHTRYVTPERFKQALSLR